MSDVQTCKQSYERGQALADLCRSYQIGPELFEESGNLDRLLARVLEDCDQRLQQLSAPVFEAEQTTGETPGREDPLERLRSLVAFAREAAALREGGDSSFSVVSGIDDLERLKNQAAPEASGIAAQSTERALELCSDVARLCHKINNPLTSLMGRAQLLQLQPDPAPASLLKATEVIEESARRVAGVVQELAHVVCQGKEDLLTK